MLFTQSQRIARYHAEEKVDLLLDIFSDDSCVDLLTFDSTLSSVNNGTMTVTEGEVSFPQGAFGASVYGGGDTIVNGLTDFVFTGAKNNSCAISFWIKPGSLIGNDIFNTSFSFRNDLWGICYVGQQDDMFYLSSGAGSGVEVPDLFESDTWHHIVFVYDAENSIADVFVDGVNRASDSFTERYDNFDDQNSGLDVCGSACCGDTYYSDSAIDQVRFFSRAITQQEVQILMKEHFLAGGIYQSETVEAYTVDRMTQGATLQKYTLQSITQSQTVNESYTIETISQKQNIKDNNTVILVQSARVRTQYESNWFRQMQRVHEYQPYTDKKNTCDIFSGAHEIVYFAPFEDSLTNDCYSSTFTAKGSGALFADGGKWGRAFKLDGNRWLYSGGRAVGDAYCLSLWFTVGSSGTVLNFGDYIHIYFDTAKTLHIDVGNDISYLSHTGQFDGLPVQAILNISSGRCVIYINGERVIDGTVGTVVSYGFLTLGAIDEFDGNDRVTNGIIDQLRLISGELTGTQLMAIVYDATAGDPFVQAGSIHEYTITKCGQSLSVEPYHDAPFKQSAYLFSKNFLKFKQHATIEQGWRNRIILRQSASLLGTNAPVRIIRKN